MTTPLWCLVIVAFLPYCIAGVGAYFRLKAPGGLDNKNPRAQASELEGVGQRAYAAQQNAWEALSVFTVAVGVAHLAGADPAGSALAAQIFVITRLLHPVTYLANLDIVRSGVFAVGIGACGYLVRLAAIAG